MAASSVNFSDRLQFQKPQINLARSTAGRMWLVNLCAFLAIIQSSSSDSFSSLTVAAGALTGALIVEFLFLFRGGKARMLRDGSAVASALILTLFLPNTISPLYAMAGAAFAMAIIKHSSGGLGSNWLNPAAGGWLFIRLSWPSAFNRALEASPLSILSESLSRGVTNAQGSPLGILKVDAAGFFASPSALDGILRSFLNKTIFALSGAELPEGYMDLFASRFPGIIADRGVLALLIGTIIITASEVNRSWIPVLYLAVYSFLVRVFGALPFGGGYWNGDVIFALCSGGTLAAAFFLASDPATEAKSNRGIFLITLSGGALSFLFRFVGADPYGAVLAALFINALTPLVKVLERRQLYEKQNKTQAPGQGSRVSLVGIIFNVSPRKYS